VCHHHMVLLWNRIRRSSRGLVWSGRRPLLIAAAGCVFMIGCFGNSSGSRFTGSSSGTITVTVAPSATTVQIGTTAQFVANLTNDTSNLGVIWALTGKGCSGAACGSLSTTTSVGGVAITYTAPAGVPSPASVTLTATSVGNAAQSSSATITITATAVVSVSIVPITATVAPDATQQVYATVANDNANKGVTWTLTGSGCSGSTCGSLSAMSSASGAPIVYTAPATTPSPNTVTITATSVTDVTQSATSTITLTSPAIIVSVSPANASVATLGTAQFTATVTNDTAAKGVTWTLSGLGCSGGGCGAISPTATLTGVAATYTAPGYVPSSTVTLTARSVTDPTKISIATIVITEGQGALVPALARNSLLNGNYIFIFRGFNSSGPVSYGGVINFNGDGAISGGVEDVVTSTDAATNLSVRGVYSLSSDGRGAMVLNSSLGSTTFRFAMLAAGSGASPAGQIIEFDDATGTGNRGSGSLQLQAAAPYSNSSLGGSFAFGASGAGADGRFAAAGTFTADGNGNITNSSMDTNDAGTAQASQVFSGTYSVAANGRGTATFMPVTGPAVHVNLYLTASATSTSFFLMDTDPPSEGTANFAGQGEGQVGPFSASSLNAPAAIWSQGLDSGGADVTVGLITGDGSGGATLTTDENDNGAIRSNHLTWTYNVAANGRVTFNAGSANPPVIYLSGANSGYYVSSDGTVANGVIQPQSGAPFSLASLAGAFAGSTLAPALPSVPNTSLALTIDSSGNVSSTEDTSGPNGLQTSTSTDVVVVVAPNGRVTFASGTAVGWMISSTQCLILDVNPGDTGATLIQIFK
jgi:hypothetical protein